MGMPASSRRIVRNRRFSRAETRGLAGIASWPITRVDYRTADTPLRPLRGHLPINGEESKKRGGACSGHRLDRFPPGDTLLVSAPLYGRCLLLEANLCVN